MFEDLLGVPSRTTAQNKLKIEAHSTPNTQIGVGNLLFPFPSTSNQQRGGTIKCFHWIEGKPSNLGCDIGHTALLATKAITSF
jgi:hypothetical protein